MRFKCWTVESQQEGKLNVVEMRMFRWISGHTRQDRIGNKIIREKVGLDIRGEDLYKHR